MRVVTFNTDDCLVHKQQKVKRARVEEERPLFVDVHRPRPRQSAPHAFGGSVGGSSSGGVGGIFGNGNRFQLFQR